MIDNNKMKIGLAAIALAASVPHAAATNGDHMLGLSAIQNGMAGAVVAAPQEATTVLVNPAGMAELNIKDVRFDLGVGFLNPLRAGQRLRQRFQPVHDAVGRGCLPCQRSADLGHGPRWRLRLGCRFPRHHGCAGQSIPRHHQAVLQGRAWLRLSGERQRIDRRHGQPQLPEPRPVGFFADRSL